MGNNLSAMCNLEDLLFLFVVFVIFGRFVIVNICYMYLHIDCFSTIILQERNMYGMDSEPQNYLETTTNVWSQNKQIRVISSHLKWWVAVARYNLNWVKFKLFYLAF